MLNRINVRNFEGDDLPDGTWGICRIHNVTRLVNENGEFSQAGICQSCWAESRDERFFACPKHGLQPKTPGKDGCPIGDCLGESVGPTEAEVEAAAESIGRIWPGGAQSRQNVLDAPQPGPPGERDREAVASAPREAPRVPPDDGRGIVDGFLWRDPFLNP